MDTGSDKERTTRQAAARAYAERLVALLNEGQDAGHLCS